MSKRWPSSPDELKAEREAWMALSEADRAAVRLAIYAIDSGEKPKKKPKKKKRLYTHEEWQLARAETFASHGRICYLCKIAEATQVDHVRPKSKFPELALVRSNLRPVCWPCNKRKGAQVA
jgi:5-methylcytosine-specific restriction endonuclease McrA